MPAHPEPGPGTPSTRSRIVPSPYEPGDGPVPFLVRLDVSARTDHAWVRDALELRPVTAAISGQVRSWNVLGHGGTSLVFEDFDPRPRRVDPWDGFPSTGLHLLDLTDGSVRPLPVRRLEGLPARTEVAVAPDGRVAVADNVLQAPQGRPPTGRDGLLAISVTTPGTATSHELFRHRAGLWSGPADRPVQWSPDGSRIALSITDLAGDPMRPIPVRTLLLDATTGAVVRTLDAVTIAGSASWTPDATRLLVVDADGQLLLADTETGALPPLRRPLRRPSGGARRWDVIGTAGRDRLLVFHQRGRTGRGAVTSVTGDDDREITSWRGEVDMYPTAAPMPDGFWD